jgi:hypothetical protein
MANFCPKCGKTLSVSGKFCPNCGVGLPETNPVQFSVLEQSKTSSGSGFDTPGNLSGKSSSAPNIGNIPVKKTAHPVMAAITVIVAILILLWGMQSMFSTVRTCIRSSSGGVPECSDCEITSRKTTLNGKSLGNCVAVPGTGSYSDQCSLNCDNGFYGPQK